MITLIIKAFLRLYRTKTNENILSLIYETKSLKKSEGVVSFHISNYLKNVF